MTMVNKIGWTDRTWNPISGCDPVSEGCARCYAKRMATRLAGRYGYPADEPFRVTLHPDKLDEPHKWKKPQRVFVCSMSDLFHERISDEAIDTILRVTLKNRQHTYMILTKRPERMREHMVGHFYALHHEIMPWPHLWLGVTVENDRHYDRIDHLMQTPAAVRFVSVEPMLGPVDISRYLKSGLEHWDEGHPESPDPTWPGGYSHKMPGLGWVIAGAESGPGARGINPNWVRSLRDQCVAARIPFWFKGWGASLANHITEHGEGSLDGRLWHQRSGDPLP
jgi:protein gp37